MSGPVAGCEIRRAVASDLEPLLQLEQAIFGADAWSARSVAEEVVPPVGAAILRRVGLVASVKGQVAGYALARHSGEATDLLRLAVHPAFRRSGVATALVGSIADFARAGHCSHVLLEVAAGNESALSLYTALGFKVLDQRVRYFAGGDDALVLQKAM